MMNSFFWTVLGIMTGLLVLPILNSKYPKQLKVGVAFIGVVALGLALSGISDQTSYWRAKNTPWLTTESEREHANSVDELKTITEQVEEIYNKDVDHYLQNQKELMDRTVSLDVEPIDYEALQNAKMLPESN